MLKRFFQPTVQSDFASTALLLLRVIAGVAFILHGWGKIQTPMSWLPEGAPINIPGFLQLLAAVSEFGGGVCWILGLFMPLASIGMLITMIVATLVHMLVFKDPFVNPAIGSSYEPALMYVGVSLALLGVGPGNFSIDRFIFGMKGQRQSRS